MSIGIKKFIFAIPVLLVLTSCSCAFKRSDPKPFVPKQVTDMARAGIIEAEPFDVNGDEGFDESQTSKKGIKEEV